MDINNCITYFGIFIACIVLIHLILSIVIEKSYFYNKPVYSELEKKKCLKIDKKFYKYVKKHQSEFSDKTIRKAEKYLSKYSHKEK